MSKPANAAQQAAGQAFRDLHLAGRTFLLPNPWDAGSARLLAGLGFAALATTSAGLAHTLGRPDGANRVELAETLANIQAITATTDLPVSADLESGFSDDAAGVGESFRLAAAAGAVGASIEDTTGNPAAPIRSLAEAVERVSAAVQAARSLPFPFTVTARADNYLYGRTDPADTIARLQAYQQAGADVLYAPALPDLATVRQVCAELDRPVNVLAAPQFSVSALSDCGVVRISLGSGLSRAALGAVSAVAAELLRTGSFDFLTAALPYPLANALMQRA
ncbi:MAG: isocitrate lyase/phosphoenolpyruvate mutase family protein, partial [Jatrophihabitantaceae bacterium]